MFFIHPRKYQLVRVDIPSTRVKPNMSPNPFEREKKFENIYELAIWKRSSSSSIFMNDWRVYKILYFSHKFGALIMYSQNSFECWSFRILMPQYQRVSACTKVDAPSILVVCNPKNSVSWQSARDAVAVRAVVGRCCSLAPITHSSWHPLWPPRPSSFLRFLS